MVTIRDIEERDAASFLHLCLRLDHETPFMLLEPGERRTTVEEQRAHIQAIRSSDAHALLVAEHDDHLVGYIAATGGTFRRNRHSAYLVIGVVQGYAGQGIGTRLFRAVEQWAHERHLHRLELTVMTHNTMAIHLYHKCGFTLEGTKRHSLVVDSAYVDEYYMAKLLS